MSLSKKQGSVLKGMITGVFSAALILVISSLYNLLVISRIAKQSFFSSEDIDGGGLSAGSGEIKILQSLLQNTLEQFTIAFIAYLAWALIMPPAWISVVPVAALGFTLSFYPSTLMLFSSVLMLIWQV